MTEYFAYITRIKNIRPIPKADNLVVGDVFGQEVVVGKDTREGQMGIFFPADGRLLDEFLTYNNLVRKVNEDGTKSGSFDANGKFVFKKFVVRSQMVSSVLLSISNMLAMWTTLMTVKNLTRSTGISSVRSMS